MQLKKLAKRGLKNHSQPYIDIGHRTTKNNQKCAFELEEKSEQIHVIRQSGVVATETVIAPTPKEKLIQAKRKRQLKTKVKRDKKKAKKKQKLDEETQDKVEHATEYVKDNFEFGETVHCPPNLTVKPRKAVINDFENRVRKKSQTYCCFIVLIINYFCFQPGRKDDLFLKSMLVDAGHSKKAKKISDVILKKPSKSALQRKAFTGKRKALSLADRRIIEKERDSAVLAYRQLKKNVTNKTD